MPSWIPMMVVGATGGAIGNQQMKSKWKTHVRMMLWMVTVLRSNAHSMNAFLFQNDFASLPDLCLTSNDFAAKEGTMWWLEARSGVCCGVLAWYLHCVFCSLHGICSVWFGGCLSSKSFACSVVLVDKLCEWELQSDGFSWVLYRYPRYCNARLDEFWQTLVMFRRVLAYGFENTAPQFDGA